MKHPYSSIGDYARWDRGVADVAAGELDPVVRFPLKVAPEQPVMTAGSCFAQHISRHLRDAGFNYLVTEPGHVLLPEAIRREFSYGVFTARFGNIYTSRQLEQLFRRAYGTFSPVEPAWTRADGRFADPFRPLIQPRGFATREELDADRRQHLAAVRRAFESLDVFVFTFGLTECWQSADDGAVFPLAPGVAGGVYDPGRYTCVNLGVDDVVGDMTRFIAALRGINPGAAVVLTVSPVPLNATAFDRHVLVSSTYSKAVLRVAAERLATTIDRVHYFPAYEIVTAPSTGENYFADDLRSVTAVGVEHVMSLFFRHATTAGAAWKPAAAPVKQKQRGTLAKALEVQCDEELLTLSQGPES
jgi:GSCFA family